MLEFARRYGNASSEIDIDQCLDDCLYVVFDTGGGGYTWFSKDFIASHENLFTPQQTIKMGSGAINNDSDANTATQLYTLNQDICFADHCMSQGKTVGGLVLTSDQVGADAILSFFEIIELHSWYFDFPHQRYTVLK
jgi:hypothetical protein